MPRERYPDKPGLGDVVHDLVGTGAHALVKIGVPLDAAESLLDAVSILFPAPLKKRQKEFIDGLAEKVELHGAVLAASPIADPESFAAFATGIFRQVSETAERDKIAYFQNALLNAALQEVDQLDYLRSLLDALTVDHIRVLSFFSVAQKGRILLPAHLAEGAAKSVVDAMPEFRGRREYAEVLFRDLWGRCLLAFPLDVSGILPPGVEKLYTLDGPRLSPLGTAFLDLIREPVEKD